MTFFSGNIPWNKGIPRDKKTLKKISKSQMGENNSFYGKKHTKKTIKFFSKQRTREKNPNWKGVVIKKGYVLIYCHNHPFRNHANRVQEHRLIIEKQIGRYLTKKEKVHHLDEIKSNNSPKNLMAFTSESAHQRFHFNPQSVKPSEIIFDGRKL